MPGVQKERRHVIADSQDEIGKSKYQNNRNDMSSAFDTIDQEQLLEILKPVIYEDEIRLIQLLLGNTNTGMKINGTKENISLMSSVGTPQVIV